MPLSSKLRADYIEMINQALDAIPVEKPADFRLASNELKKIINSTAGSTPDFDDQLKESMQLIHNLKIRMESEINDFAYQQIIQDKIQSKINEFNLFNAAQKFQYVRDQKDQIDSLKSLNENTTSILDAAFRRAAMCDTSEDLEKLKLLGANVNGQSINGSTALHLAVLNDKEDNVKYLLTLRASRHIENHSGMTVKQYALHSKNEKIRLLFPNNLNPMTRVYDVISTCIMSYLTAEEVISAQTVCFFWYVASRAQIEERLEFLTPEQRVVYNTLERPLKFALLQTIISHKKMEETNKFFLALQMRDFASRVKLLVEEPAVILANPFYANYFMSPASLFIFISHLLNIESLRSTHLGTYDVFLNSRTALILSLEWIKIASLLDPQGKLCMMTDYNSLFTPLGFVALHEKLLSLEQIKSLNHNPYGSRRNPSRVYLPKLLTPNGLMALRKGILSVEDAANIDELEVLLSDLGMQAIKEQLISVEQAKNLFYHSGSVNGAHSNLKYLITSNGLQALRERLITVEQCSKIASLQSLLTEHGLIALKEGLLTPELAFYHRPAGYGPYNSMCVFLNKRGLQVLREQLITPMDASKIINLDVLFMSDSCLFALRFKLIKISDLYYNSNSKLGSMSPADLEKEMQKLVLNFKSKSALNIQSLFRSHLAKSKVDCLKRLNVLNLDSDPQFSSYLTDIRRKILSGKVHEARLAITALEARHGLTVARNVAISI